MSDRELVLNYKREKFGELIRNKEQVQKNNEEWMNEIKQFCKPEYVEERDKATKTLEEARKNSIKLFSKIRNQSELSSSFGLDEKENNSTEELQIG